MLKFLLIAVLGLFENATDVGDTPRAGMAEFNQSTGEYRITGGGANMWADKDAFRFVWRRISGDFDLQADVRFLGAGAVAHRKAALIFRQSLDANSPYADVAWHGDGLTSLQSRPTAGAQTEQIESPLKAPGRIRIERRGNRFTLYAGNPGEELRPTGPVTVELKDPIYAGLAVCSHDATVLETAVFSNVVAQAPAPRVRSKLWIYNLDTKRSTNVYTADRHFEAPNWSKDGTYLLINADGSLYRLPLTQQSPEPVKLNLGEVQGCNNDHGFTRDGTRLAISARGVTPASQIYVAGADGSGVRRVTEKYPSYFHGWSPDGKWIAFVGQREGTFNIYRIPVEGGEEERLTSQPVNDDGPEFSVDGKWIYFNSDRSGHSNIWRMPADGAGPGDDRVEQVTKDEYEDWFPHFSPDGKWLVFLSYQKGTKGHPANQQNVLLRMMRTPGAKVKPGASDALVRLFGGQGTMNVNSWSPDSKKFAYVT